MRPLKLSTLTLALLGAIALTACDNTTDTAAVDTYEPDATAADTQPVDDTAPVADVPEPTATDEYGSTDPTTTMGDVDDFDETELGEDETEVLDPTEPDPADPYAEDQMDPADPVDESEPPR